MVFHIAVRIHLVLLRPRFSPAQQVIDLLRERQQIAGAEHGLTIERLAQVESIVRQQREEARRLSDELIDSRLFIYLAYACPCSN
jgi:hypothetical protein